MTPERRHFGRAISKVLDAAEIVGVRYEVALGFFSETDFSLVRDGVYGPEQIEHALRFGIPADEGTANALGRHSGPRVFA